MTFLRIRPVLVLTRYKVSLAVAFSGFATAVAFAREITWSQFLPMTGILLLASGASALNQCQEKEFDARMSRTKNRPLPSGDLTLSAALSITFLFILSGLIVLFLTSPLITIFLGIFNIFWYNGIYTYLKRKTAFAVVPGALTGVIPVFMGWTSAGGYLFDFFPLLLGFFIFMWQVPHFWLLGMIYDKDYKNGGFPVMTDLFQPRAIHRIIFSWLLAASLSSLLIILFVHIHHAFTSVLTLLLNLLLLIISTWFLFLAKKINYRLLFIMINLFMLLVFCFLIADWILP